MIESHTLDIANTHAGLSTETQTNGAQGIDLRCGLFPIEYRKSPAVITMDSNGMIRPEFWQVGADLPDPSNDFYLLSQEHGAFL